jgi:hypothetical protein
MDNSGIPKGRHRRNTRSQRMRGKRRTKKRGLTRTKRNRSRTKKNHSRTKKNHSRQRRKIAKIKSSKRKKKRTKKRTMRGGELKCTSHESYHNHSNCSSAFVNSNMSGVHEKPPETFNPEDGGPEHTFWGTISSHHNIEHYTGSGAEPGFWPLTALYQIRSIGGDDVANEFLEKLMMMNFDKTWLNDEINNMLTLLRKMRYSAMSEIINSTKEGHADKSPQDHWEDAKSSRKVRKIIQYIDFIGDPRWSPLESFGDVPARDRRDKAEDNIDNLLGGPAWIDEQRRIRESAALAVQERRKINQELGVAPLPHRPPSPAGD